MTFATDFRHQPPAPTITRQDIEARWPALPDGWTAADDANLMEGLFRGLSLEAIGNQIDQRTGNVDARWKALKRAAGVEQGAVPWAAQMALLEIARERSIG